MELELKSLVMLAVPSGGAAEGFLMIEHSLNDKLITYGSTTTLHTL